MKISPTALAAAAFVAAIVTIQAAPVVVSSYGGPAAVAAPTQERRATDLEAEQLAVRSPNIIKEGSEEAGSITTSLLGGTRDSSIDSTPLLRDDLSRSLGNFNELLAPAPKSRFGLRRLKTPFQSLKAKLNARLARVFQAKAEPLKKLESDFVKKYRAIPAVAENGNKVPTGAVSSLLPFNMEKPGYELYTIPFGAKGIKDIRSIAGYLSAAQALERGEPLMWFPLDFKP